MATTAPKYLPDTSILVHYVRQSALDLLRKSGTRTYPTQKQPSYGRNSLALRVRSTARRNAPSRKFISLYSCKRSIVSACERKLSACANRSAACSQHRNGRRNFVARRAVELGSRPQAKSGNIHLSLSGVLFGLSRHHSGLYRIR